MMAWRPVLAILPGEQTSKESRFGWVSWIFRTYQNPNMALFVAPNDPQIFFSFTYPAYPKIETQKKTLRGAFTAMACAPSEHWSAWMRPACSAADGDDVKDITQTIDI